MTKISIITINYNNAEGLERTIKSVTGQSYKDLEYIVIDGDSSDGSKDVIAAHKDNIAFSVSEKDEGVYAAQNKGLRKATGDYILVLNSGDELAGPTVLADVFSTEHTEDIIYGDMIIVHPDGRKEQGTMPEQITREHMLRDTLWHPVSFVKRSFLKTVGTYNTSYRIVADYQWFLRAILRHKAVMKHAQKTISVFYLGGMSSDPKNSEQLKMERLEAQRQVLEGIKPNLEHPQAMQKPRQDREKAADKKSPSTEKKSTDKKSSSTDRKSPSGDKKPRGEKKPRADKSPRVEKTARPTDKKPLPPGKKHAPSTGKSLQKEKKSFFSRIMGLFKS